MVKKRFKGVCSLIFSDVIFSRSFKDHGENIEMPTRAQKIRLSIFVILTFLALIALIGFITSQEFLKKVDTYYIAYENVSVSGLEVGSPVKYLGIKVGVVEDIHIDPENVNRVIVKVELQDGTPIKNDARADINTIGITGLKTIEIRGGSNEAPLLKEGKFIRAGTSLTEEITGKAEVITQKMEVILNNLQDFTRPENLKKFVDLAENTNSAFVKMESLLDENRQDLRETIELSKNTAIRLEASSQTLQATLEDIRRIVGSDTVRQILTNTRAISLKLKEADLVTLIEQVQEIAIQTKQLLNMMDEGLERGGRDFQESMRQLKITSEYLQEFSQSLQQDPSVILRGTEVKNMPDEYLEKD